MTDRKIESDRLAEVIEAFRQSASEQTLPPKLDAVDLAPDTIADAFATAAAATDHRAAATAAPSLREAIAEFVMPRISNPALLHGARATLVLERLVSEVLPALEGSEELRALASTVLVDEVGRHRELATRIHAGLAA